MAKNIIEVDPGKFPWLDLRRYTFAMGVESKGLLHIAGQTASAYDPQSNRVVCKGGVVEQAKVAFEKMGVILEAAGMSFQDVVKTVDYVDPVALPQYRQTAEVRRQYLGSAPVASTGICVHRLLRPDAVIEISAIAMKGDKRAINPGWHRYQQLTYAPGVQVDDILWLSGFIGSEDVDGVRHYPQNTPRQVSLCYSTIGEVLAAAGGEAGDVVNTVDYIAPRSVLQYPDTAVIRRQFYGASRPASTGIVVDRLLRPEGHVEIEAVAVLGGDRQEIHMPEWAQTYQHLTYHPAVKKGRLLCLSGQASIEHTTGKSVGGFDMAVQADKAYGNIAQVMSAGGYSMDDVVHTIEWVVPNGLQGYRDVQEVRRKYFGDRFPASTGVLAHELLRPETLIEVSAVAVI